MNVYQLHIQPGEYDGDGENHDEFFSNLELAKMRRSDLKKESPYAGGGSRGGEDFEIERLTLTKLSPKELILACLNRKYFVAESEVVVPAWVRSFPPDDPE